MQRAAALEREREEAEQELLCRVEDLSQGFAAARRRLFESIAEEET